MQVTAADEIPPILVTPDKVETRIGTLEFKDGAPSAETVEKVYDTLDFTRGLDAFLNSYGGASAYAIRKGLLSIGAEDNTVTIFPELMDSKSLFLTANADTVYYFSIVDLTKGPMVVEQPPKGRRHHQRHVVPVDHRHRVPRSRPRRRRKIPAPATGL